MFRKELNQLFYSIRLLPGIQLVSPRFKRLTANICLLAEGHDWEKYQQTTRFFIFISSSRILQATHTHTRHM